MQMSILKTQYAPNDFSINLFAGSENVAGYHAIPEGMADMYRDRWVEIWPAANVVERHIDELSKAS